MRISAIVPCYNEEENLTEAYRQFTQALRIYDDYEIIFTDDGSSDRSLQIIKDFAAKDVRVKYIALSRNYGNNPAFRIGYRYAKFEWCIQYDCDLQSPPEESHKLIEKAREGFDAVFAIREQRNDPFYRVGGTRLQQFIATRLLGIELPIGASVFRVLRTDIARQVVDHPTRTDYFIATLPLVTSNYVTVPTRHNARRAGRSKWNWSKMISHTLDLFFGFSYVPLQVIWAFVLIGPLLVILTGSGLGMSWPLSLAVLGVLQLLALAITGEYLRRPAGGFALPIVYVKASNISLCRQDFGLADPASKGR